MKNRQVLNKYGFNRLSGCFLMVLVFAKRFNSNSRPGKNSFHGRIAGTFFEFSVEKPDLARVNKNLVQVELTEIKL
ncbi:hypothetical protein Barb7_01581 [Bacteroidales bacterium Barb7]|nr:hypothetical protein Barb7_01581 [Bacteroidales bacterium Barb7]